MHLCSNLKSIYWLIQGGWPLQMGSTVYDISMHRECIDKSFKMINEQS